MDTFLMICYVCADFVGKTGEIFQITTKELGIFVHAPAWIKETIMYKWLLNDGSIKVGLDKEGQKRLENDPMQGVSAEGKDEAVTEAAEAEEEAPEEVAEEEAPKTAPKKTTKSKKGEGK